MSAAVASIYSLEGRQMMKAALERTKPDLVHVHNFFPTLSPSIFEACNNADIPVVHTLHNYRLVCAAATLFRSGSVCEECVDARSFLPGVRHACYRNSHFGSAVAGIGMSVHDRLGTWSDKVAAYIALTEFAADKLGVFRVPRHKVIVKPNFVSDVGIGAGTGGYALFVGRLTHEKGIKTILEANAAGSLHVDVVIIGDGPLRQEVELAAASSGSRLRYLGFLPHGQVLAYMAEALVLLVPSLWYEGLPLTIIEAFCLGLPPIAANLGNLASIIEDGKTGFLYSPGDHRALSSALAWCVANPAAVKRMRLSCRQCYLAKYTPDENYKQLIAIYERAVRGGLPGS